MSNDESNFDTMRLIAGASESKLYSLEDILQEFSPDGTDAPGKKPVANKRGENTPAPQDVTEISAHKQPETEPVKTPDMPAQPEAELPEYHSQTDSEIADAIAQAVAASFQTTDTARQAEPALVISESEIWEPESDEPEPQTDSAPEKSAEQPENDPAKAPVQPAPDKKQESGKTNAAEAEKSKPKNPERTQKKEKTAAVPNVRTTGQVTEQKVANPGTKHSKIPRSRVHVGTAEMLGLMLGDLHSRQRQDLPGGSASLKAAEKHNAFLARICGIFSPVRYVILVLMVFALAGRKYSWMLLGFLGGETGSTVALAALLAAMVASWNSVFRAVKDILYLRFSYESLLLITAILSAAETMAYRNPETLLPFVTIGWCLVGTTDLMMTRGKLRSLRTVIAGKTRTGVRIAEDKWEHTDCIGKATASTAGFVRHQEEVDTWHTGWFVYGITLLTVALVASAYLTPKTEGNYLTILVTLLTVSLPVSGVFCCARPYELLSRALGRGGAVSGWFGMKALSGRKAILIYDSDLFPKGTITHKGVKVYGNQTPELLVSYGTSLVLRADNGLSEPFTRLLRETGGQIYHVSYFQATEGGLTGRINGVLVAVGTYNFMQLMGVVLPKNAPRGGVFIALNGEVAGLFAMKYRVKAGAAEGFHRLVRDHRLTLLAATKNLCVNPSFVMKWFQVPVGQMLCPKAETRRALSEPALLTRGTTCGYVTGEGISTYSRLVAGARRSYRMGLIFTTLSICYSAFMMIWAIIKISAGAALVTGVQLLAVQILLFVLIELAARVSVT